MLFQRDLTPEVLGGRVLVRPPPVVDPPLRFTVWGVVWRFSGWPAVAVVASRVTA